jgi:hypothetical protein
MLREELLAGPGLMRGIGMSRYGKQEKEGAKWERNVFGSR